MVNRMVTMANRYSISAFALAVAFGAPGAIAQDASGSDETNAQEDSTADQTLRYDEVVVTSTRREENLQDVPLAVTAIGERDIEKLNYDRFEDLARSVPGLTLNQGEKNRATFVIRGISTNSGINSTQDPASVYIDDMLVTDSYAASVTPDLRLFDINRVEVLRGPQGTLFGSGSLSGTVRVITNQPDTSQYESAVRAGIATTDGALGYNLDGMINAPLANGRAAIRAVGYYRDTPGYTYNQTLNIQDSNREEAYGGRVAMLWQLTDQFSAKASALYQNSKPEDGSLINPSLGDYTRDTVVPERRTAEMQFYNLNLNYETSFADITSLTSYNLKDGYYMDDFSQLIGLLPYVLEVGDDSKIFSQEVRVASNTDGPLDWLVGAYYLKYSRDMDLKLLSPGLVQNGPLFGLSGVTTDLLTSRPQSIPSEETAIFADSTYQLNDNWSVFGGIRYAEFDTSYTRTNIDAQVLTTVILIARGLLTPPVPVNFTSTTESGETSGSATTGRLGVRWTPSDDVQIYASASRGFRVGQINTGYGPDPVDPVNGLNVPQGYDPDSLWNYELGLKSSLFDDRLIFNAALFYIDWKDIQIAANRPTDRRVFIANAGAAESKGLEIELRAFPSDTVELGFSGSVQNSEITEISSEETLLTGAVVGDRLPSAAELQGSAYVEFHDRFAKIDGDWYVRLTGQYVGDSVNGYSLAPVSGAANPQLREQPSYEVLNLNSGIRWDNAELSFFVSNVFDSDSVVQIDPTRTTTTGIPSNNTLLLTPRTIGLSLTLRQ